MTYPVENRLLTALATIRDHWAALHVMPSGANAGVKSSDVITGIDARVSLAHEVTLHLNGWARVVVEERGTKHGIPLGTDTLGLVEFLARHANWLAFSEAGEPCADELTEWARKVQLTAVPPVKDWISIGECPLVVTVEGTDIETYCAGDVRAYREQDPTCQECGTSAVWSWWQKRMNPDARDYVSADEMVGLLYKAMGTPVKPTTIRQWVARGHISPLACALGTRRNLYDIEDVIRHASRHAA